jgi:hypothetical protein
MEYILMDNDFMKRLLLVFFTFSIAGASSIRAQVVPSANGSEFQLTAGVLGSALQPDLSYSNQIGSNNYDPIGTSPNRVYGVGTYVDVRLSRWFQPEAEARWSEFNTQGEGNREDTYLFGPRVPIYTFHWMHATPYGKFLIGWGRNSTFLLPPSTLAIAYGGGLDMRLTKHITLRAIDFEFQQWRVMPTLYPYEGSVGLSYRIF